MAGPGFVRGGVFDAADVAAAARLPPSLLRSKHLQPMHGKQHDSRTMTAAPAMLRPRLSPAPATHRDSLCGSAGLKKRGAISTSHLGSISHTCGRHRQAGEQTGAAPHFAGGRAAHRGAASQRRRGGSQPAPTTAWWAAPPACVGAPKNANATPATHLPHVLLGGQHQLVVDHPLRLVLEDGAGGVDEHRLLLHHCGSARRGEGGHAQGGGGGQVEGPREDEATACTRPASCVRAVCPTAFHPRSTNMLSRNKHSKTERQPAAPNAGRTHPSCSPPARPCARRGRRSRSRWPSGSSGSCGRLRL